MNKEHKKTIRLDSTGWGLVLDLKGGRIVSLYHKEKRILGTYNRIDGKSGNTHVCIPNFAGEGAKLDLPFHGPTRNATWNIKEKRRYSLAIWCDVPATNLYPARLHIEQSFKMQDNFIHEIKVTNVEGVGVPLNIGCHYYWDSPKGWEGTKINNEDISVKIQTNGFQKIETKNLIILPHSTYTVTQTGFSKVILWTGFKIEDDKKIFDTTYCCIEPVRGEGDFFGGEESLIPPGGTVSTSFQIGETV